MYLEEIGVNAGNWVDSAQDRNYWRALVNAALNLRVLEAMELVNVIIAYVTCRCSIIYFKMCLLTFFQFSFVF